MSQAGIVRLSRIADSKRNAANCKMLAQKAQDEQDRARWLRMEQFWLSRAYSAEQEGEQSHKMVEV